MHPSPSQHPSAAELQAIAYLRNPVAIRERSHQLFELALADHLAHFSLDLSQLQPTADFVIKVMQENYPTLDVPFHSRWRHFQAGGCDRVALLTQALQETDPLEVARAKFDLVVPSVLLDAGAGAAWQFVEPDRQQIFQRSEGLAVATFHMFLEGQFSNDLSIPYQTCARCLKTFSEADLSRGFQIGETNPIVGLAGRVSLLRELGFALEQHPTLFGSENPRPGGLVDYLLSHVDRGQLSATVVFQAVLDGFSQIFPGRLAIADVNLGDVWVHSALPSEAVGAQLVPFHKLSQWLTYSLLEPLQELGIAITNLDQLTGLPEYRNGGLFFDCGVLRPKHEQVTTIAHPPASELIVEWRALTVILLDQVAALIRDQLGLNSHSLPLVKVLEGGTWAAGRRIASDLRPDGRPPIAIASDGTVF